MIKDELKRRNNLGIAIVSITSLLAGMLFSITTDGYTIITIISGGGTGLIIGCCIILFETYLSSRISKKFSFIITIVSKGAIYSLIILGALILNMQSIIHFDNYDYTLREYVLHDTFRLSVLFSISLTFIFITFFQLNDLIGRGVLFKFFLGRYHSPREEQRIFMFLDLKNSTGIAEEMGDIKFLSLINDFFYDLTNPVLSTGGEIYKYVGDEAIICWNFKKGLKNNNALKTFFILKEVIEGKRDYYQDKYSFVPQFKAGIHGGKVVTGEIGVSKKEITYLGDILNTTARIEGLCNILDEDFLISEELLFKFNIDDKSRLREYKDREIRGKEQPITIYSLDY